MLGYVAANDSHAARLHQTHGDMGLYASGDDCFSGAAGPAHPARAPGPPSGNRPDPGALAGRAPGGGPGAAPGLESDPGHALWKRDFSGACGCLAWCSSRCPMPLSRPLSMDCGIFGIGYSWGGFESLIVPAHIRRSAGRFEAEGPVLRIHAGLEDAGDLIADLEKAWNA